MMRIGGTRARDELTGREEGFIPALPCVIETGGDKSLFLTIIVLTATNAAEGLIREYQN